MVDLVSAWHLASGYEGAEISIISGCIHIRLFNVLTLVELDSQNFDFKFLPVDDDICIVGYG